MNEDAPISIAGAVTDVFAHRVVVKTTVNGMTLGIVRQAGFNRQNGRKRAWRFPAWLPGS